MLKQKPIMEIKENEYFSNGVNRKVKQLTVSLYDLKLRCDINEDRDFALAKRLAGDLGVELKILT